MRGGGRAACEQQGRGRAARREPSNRCRAFPAVMCRIAFWNGREFQTRWRSIVAANSGRLAVISTPIGNLGDLSPRARDELAAAELVAAEDTRRTGQLLTTLGLSRPLVSLHEHNEGERIGELLRATARRRAHRAGQRCGHAAAVGSRLRAGAPRGAGGHHIVAVPGPSAITAALSIAGLPTERFSFEGFLPARLAERRARLAELAARNAHAGVFRSAASHRRDASRT